MRITGSLVLVSTLLGWTLNPNLPGRTQRHRSAPRRPA